MPIIPNSDSIMQSHEGFFTATPEDAGLRLDKFLRNNIPGHSRAFLQSLIKSGNVLVNSKMATPTYRMRTGDIVETAVPDASSGLSAATDLDIPVIFENDEIIVINKPAGIVVHPLREDQKGTVANWVLAHDANVRGVGDSPLRPGIVHRLDKWTSGVMVLARTPQAFIVLKKAFHDRHMRKEYVALLERIPAQLEGEVEGYITASKHEHRRKTLSALPIAHESKTSLTRYRVLEALGPGCRAEFKPETGRTHQIRVHAKSLGAPILGDQLYGAKLELPPQLAGRFYLHAQSLSFQLPGWAAERVFKSPLPDQFNAAAAWLSKQGVDPR